VAPGEPISAARRREGAPPDPGDDGRRVQRVGRATSSTDALGDLVLPDDAGRDVRLGDLWRDGPVVLVWLRHYG
jgi:hypothetical protein